MTVSISILRWDEILAAVQGLRARWWGKYTAPRGIFGVPTGGSVVAALLASPLDSLLDEPKPGCLVVDDMVDSGATLSKYHALGFKTDALYRKPDAPAHLAPQALVARGWIKFPWEHSPEPQDATQRVLQYLGADLQSEGLRETPGRYLRALKELTEGYALDPEVILQKTFKVDYDQMVVVRGIRFCSLCEHHVLPFHGTVTVGYLPTGRVVGLSKIPRLVHCFARRLQVQERLTEQIAHALNNALRPLGVGVLVRGYHTCMAMRGIRSEGEMVTSCLLGVMRDEAREEFLRHDEARRP
jgi:GTP cyclohydrolase I